MVTFVYILQMVTVSYMFPTLLSCLGDGSRWLRVFPLFSVVLETVTFCYMFPLESFSSHEEHC